MSQIKSVIVPNPNAVFGKIFYEYVSKGVLSFDVIAVIGSKKGTDQNYDINIEDLHSTEDKFIINELQQIIFNWPKPMIRGGHVNVDDIETQLVSSLQKLNSLVQGTADFMMELIEKNEGYAYFSWPNYVYQQSMKDEGWSVVSKSPFTGGGTVQIGTKYDFKKGTNIGWQKLRDFLGLGSL